MLRPFKASPGIIGFIIEGLLDGLYKNLHYLSDSPMLTTLTSRAYKKVLYYQHKLQVKCFKTSMLSHGLQNLGWPFDSNWKMTRDSMACTGQWMPYGSRRSSDWAGDNGCLGSESFSEISWWHDRSALESCSSICISSKVSTDQKQHIATNTMQICDVTKHPIVQLCSKYWQEKTLSFPPGSREQTLLQHPGLLPQVTFLISQVENILLKT